MADSSFDVVSKVDRQEVDNALNQAAKELSTRFDFRGTDTSIAWKGDEVIASAKELLKASRLNFTGYVEGDDIPYSKADVVVCDGFSGNVVLKFAEGLMHAVYSILKEEMGHRILPKVGMVFMIPMMKDLWSRFNYEKHGGTPLLGVNGIIVKAHGRSKAPAITNALRVARNFVIQNGVELIREELG